MLCCNNRFRILFVLITPFLSMRGMQNTACDLMQKKYHNVDSYNAEMLNPLIAHLKLIAQEKKEEVPPFIAIAGCSAVGKSYLSLRLAGLLKKVGVETCILKGDDFLDPDWNDPQHFHPRLQHAVMHSIIQKIQTGQSTVRKPAWNQKGLPSKIEEDFTVQGMDLVLYEGEFTLCNQIPYDFSKYSALGIFIDAQDDNIIDWNWSRGRDIEGTTKEEFAAMVKPALQKYRAFVQSCPARATYLITKETDHRYAVAKSVEDLAHYTN